MTQQATPIRQARILRAALEYAARGWHVFPLYEIAESGVCSCPKAGACGSPGKHPRTSTGFKAATTEEATIRAWWKKTPNANIGIATGPSRLVVVDVDPRNGGDDSFAELQKQYGRTPETLRAITGGGGSHEIFKAPGDVKSGAIALGIDIKADGGYIVASPSNHASGRTYEWDAGSEDEPADLPQWIIDRLRVVDSKQYETAENVTDGFIGAAFEAMGYLGRAVGVGKRAARCPWEDEHTSGSRYDGSTVIFAPTVGHIVGWFHCSHGHCGKRRTLDALMDKIPDDAKARAREKLGCDQSFTPADDTDAAPATIPPDYDRAWEKSLTTNAEGVLLKEPANVALVLANAPEWRGSLEYDVFSDRIRWVRPVPQLRGITAPQPGEDVQEHHCVYVAQWFRKYRRGSKFDKTAVHDGISAAARHNEVHPVKAYLGGLKWDGVRRVDEWLSRYLGAEPCDYTRTVARFWLVSCVARVYQPGCQADHLVVLEGGQGAGKSTAARILGGEWFLSSLPDIQSKDAAQVLQGHWIVEIGELDAFRGAAGTRVKDWVTRTVDSYRPAYGRFTVRRPRQCVFLGTTNESHYLTDSTGARRFWPVRVVELLRDQLSRDRDQLWAEAVALYQTGSRWWPEDAAVIERITAQQEERYQGDEWERDIADWASCHNEFTVGEILGQCLGLERGKWDRASQIRVGNCLRRLGYISRQVTRDGVRGRFYSVE